MDRVTVTQKPRCASPVRTQSPATASAIALALLVLVAGYTAFAQPAISFGILLVVGVAGHLCYRPATGLALLVTVGLLAERLVVHSADWTIVAQWLTGVQDRWFGISLGPSLLVSPLVAPVLLAAIMTNAGEAWRLAVLALLAAVLCPVVLSVTLARAPVGFQDFVTVAAPIALLRDSVLAYGLARSIPTVALLVRPLALLVALLLPVSIVPPHGFSGELPRGSASRAIAILGAADAREPELTPIGHGCGPSNHGLWGELPRFLNAAGFSASLTPDVASLAAKPPDILVILPTGRLLTGDEDRSIHALVDRGTSLLAVAEHTNLKGVMASLNPLLAPYGTQVNFDTTNSLIGDGMKALRYGEHPLGALLRATPFVTYNRGASLRLTTTEPIPVLVGVGWHADIGDPTASDSGFVGDQDVSLGDTIGDILLITAYEKEDGRVVVVGDSSPFLNQNLTYNAAFLIGLFDYLSSPSHGKMRDRVRLFSMLGLALVLVGVVVVAQAPGQVGLLLLALTTLGFGLRPQPDEAQILSGRPHLAVISTAEANAVSRDPFAATSVTALGMQLSREGFVPYLGDWYPLAQDVQALFVINPTRPLRSYRLRTLRSILEHHRRVTMAGSGESVGYTALAQAFDATVSRVPLGSRRGSRFTAASAWATDPGSSLQPFLVEGGAIGAVHPHLPLTLISDDEFFLSRDLEWEGKCDTENLAFVQEITTSGGVVIREATPAPLE